MTTVNEQGEIVKKKVQKKGKKRASTKRKVKCEMITKPLDGANTEKVKGLGEKRKRIRAGQQSLKKEEKIEVEYPEVEIDLTIEDDVEVANKRALRAQVPNKEELLLQQTSRS